MPRRVWEASGHLERFIDPVFHCKKCETMVRADKFLQEHLQNESIDGLSYDDMEKMLQQHGINCPKCGTPFGKIEEYNLMLQTSVGSGVTAYLRPETATTTYLLFNRLNQDARRQYPIKIFQYGKAFRNEISPRQLVLRMRAFDQFEIQLFIGKEQEFNFNEYIEINHNIVPLLDWKSQKAKVVIPDKISLREAVETGVLKKQAFAYCIYLGYHLAKKLGFPEEVMRLRQHSPEEMAHYADDAWDLEINTEQFGWVEICGIHDRTDYDLKRHGEFSNQNFKIQMGTDPNLKEIPQILEIAFGPDRIIYTLLETTFNIVEERMVLKINPLLAPNIVAVFPLVKNKDNILNLAKEVHKSLLDNRIASFFDSAGSIGKRYRRQDELGTPYCITIDYDSIDDNAVTIRHRDTMEQKRVLISEITDFIENNY
jgi:glycyl-tRNA synthetase